MRRIASLGLLLLLVAGQSTLRAADPLPIVTSLELQPLVAGAKRVAQGARNCRARR